MHLEKVLKSNISHKYTKYPDNTRKGVTRENTAVKRFHSGKTETHCTITTLVYASLISKYAYFYPHAQQHS